MLRVESVCECVHVDMYANVVVLKYAHAVCVCVCVCVRMCVCVCKSRVHESVNQHDGVFLCVCVWGGGMYTKVVLMKVYRCIRMCEPA